jgi:hypothetical protein
MKSKLKIEDLAVDSFVVAEQPAGPRGTVRAFGKPTQQVTLCQWTCVQDQCQPTFGYSCIETDCCGIETDIC